MRLRTKLRALFLFVIGISLVTAGLSLYSITRLSEALHASQESVQVELLIRAFRSEFTDARIAEDLRSAAARNDEADRRTRVRTDEWKAQVELLTENLGGDAELDKFLRHVATQISNVDPYLTRGREITKKFGEDSDSLVQIQNLLADSVAEILRTIDELLGKQQARVETATEIATRSEDRTLILILLTAVVLVISGFIGHFLFRNWFLRPIETLSEATHRIAHGEYDTEIPLEGEHEFGRLARDVETMSSSIEHFQSQLVEKERMAAVGEMTASVAHNVRNPLASIRALAQSGHRDPELGEPIKKALGTIIQTVDRADRWLKDLLTALRPVKIASQEEDIVKVVTDIVVGSRIFSERKGITLELEVTPDLAPIPLDRRKFEQALIILISNSVEASENDSEVTVRVHPDPSGRDRVLVEVEDRGHGMEPETLRKLFTPYFTTKKSGVGLGLCLAQKIIFGHRGTIDVDSGPSRGCRMTIWLPTTAPPLETRVSKTGAPEPGAHDTRATAELSSESSDASNTGQSPAPAPIPGPEQAPSGGSPPSAEGTPGWRRS